MTKLAHLLLAIVIAAQISQAQTNVPPTDPNIQYFGRWDWSTGDPKCTWPSLYLKAKFSGTGIKAKFTNTFYNGENLVHVLYTIDGGTPVYVNNVTEITVSNLSSGTHEIMISRRMEGNGAELTFNGFEITGGQIMTPNPRPCMKFEFVGNSITCGLANENFSSTWNDGNGQWLASGWEQNSYRSYAPVLSHLLDAEYRIESHSGQGMCVNLNNSLPEVKQPDEWELKAYYPGWNKPGWDSKHDFANDDWQADFFFCMLGTNDWTDGNYNSGAVSAECYVNRYNEFIDKVYEVNPNTTFMVLSSLLAVRGFQEGNEALKTMVAQRQAQGDDIHFVDMRGLLVSQQDFGNDWTHPTTKAHQTMANFIGNYMENDPNISAKMAGLGGCQIDCHGDLGGSAYVNACDICVEGNTGIIDECVTDCHGDENGTAFIDDCQVCAGGNTGITPNSCDFDCNGDPNGTAYIDDCEVCVAGNTGNTDCSIQACAELEFEGESENGEFDGTWGNFSYEKNNGSFVLTTTSETAQWDAVQMSLGDGMNFKAAESQKLWIRAKATSPVILQVAPKDAKGDIASNSGLAGGNWVSNKSNLIQLATEFTEFEIDFENNLSNEWDCQCELDQSQITQIYLGINPGWDSQWPVSFQDGSTVNTGFEGSIEIDYIKLGSETCSPITIANKTATFNQRTELYPNPARDVVYLNQEKSWQLFDTKGQLIDQGEGQQIDLQAQPAGLYFITIESKVHQIIHTVN